MLTRTKTTVAAAAALTLALLSPALAGEGSADITDNWNTPRGYTYDATPGWNAQEPGIVFGVPDDDGDYTTGRAPGVLLEDDDDMDVDE